MKNKLIHSTSGIFVLVVALVAVSLIAQKAFFRVDVTEDRVYSLSQGSLNIASKFQDDVLIKLYFSKSLKGIPVAFKTYATRVQEVLKEFSDNSDGKIKLEVIDPRPDSDEEVWARKYGITGAPLQNGEELYLGAVFVSADKENAIPYLDPRKEEFLEYDISEALVKLSTDKKPKLGVMSSLEVMGSPAQNPMQPHQGDEEWSIIAGLKNFFDVESIELTAESIDPDIGILLILHPKKLEEKTEYAIDQFVMGGGRLIIAVDPFSRTDLANSHQNRFQGGQMPDASSDFTRFFSKWGIEYSKSDMIGDPTRATRINAGGRAVNYPFFLSLNKDDFSKDNKVTAHLKQMLIAESGAISLKGGSTFQLEPLIKTSHQSGKQSASMANFMRPSDLAAQLKVEEKQRIIAGLLKGKLPSSFDNPPEGAKDHLTESKEEAVIAIIADVDFLHDNNAVDKIRFGPQVIVRPRNDNLNFIINTAEFLGGNQDLISIRSSGRVNRPFTTLLEIQQEAQKKWKAEEEKLSQQLNDLQKKLSSLQADRTDGNLTSLSPQQQAEITRFRNEEVKIRARRRQVRKNLREDIEKLGNQLIAANLLFVPLLVSIFGISVMIRREKRSRGN